jgi:hypothetical protein
MPSKEPASRSKLIRQTNSVVLDAATKQVALASVKLASLGGAPTWQRLACPIPLQEQTQWCWCATTLGVHKFFLPADATTQCQAANRILVRTDACVAPSSVAVNMSYYLDRALSAFCHLRAPVVAAPLAANKVEQEILSGKPVGARIGWFGGGGHFMVIEGYLAAAVPRVAIHDPIYGQSDMDYSVYQTAYQGSGSWTHSYLIQ